MSRPEGGAGSGAVAAAPGIVDWGSLLLGE